MTVEALTGNSGGHSLLDVTPDAASLEAAGGGSIRRSGVCGGASGTLQE